MFGFLKKKLSQLKEKIVGKTQEEKVKEKIEIERENEPREELNRDIQKKEKTRKKTKSSKKKGKPSERSKPRERILTKIKKKVARKIKLSQDELEGYLWDLELILLESDVAHDVAEKIISRLREELAEKEFSSREDIFNQVVRELKRSLLDLIPDSFDPLESDKKPVVIMFIGPNGAGKTTTMAKLAKKILDSGKKVVFAASDTFRAASIEQLQEHASRLGIKVIKHDYGADPAAVAYDAVQHARAKGIDFVFIDTAGRQETNKNLIEELKKIKRVVKPDYIIYVDEGIAGNVIYDRLMTFNQLGISGIILTKMDLDAKGGGAITGASLGVPVLFLGTGQEYDDIEAFDKEKFVDELLGL